MSPTDAFVRDNWVPLWIFAVALGAVFALLVEQAVDAIQRRRELRKRALSGWVGRQNATAGRRK